ncbi:hypothetical protein [uncultured Roseobacter sp.]|uniref:plasmid mobilization protein n=1 Tax=uncultured Roseobacter sp. TaxID=114847 RepID=UPI00262D287C|nr:hypothetical protein [uncultured Roseobacter sp.]
MNKFLLEDQNTYITETFNERVLEKPPKPKRKKIAPVSVRFTPEERALLDQRAGKKSLSAYIRECLLAEDAKPRRSRGLNPVKDHSALAKVLRALGASNLAHDLEQLTWAVKDGTLHLDEKSERLLRLALVSIIELRKDLLRALGLRPS